MTLDIERPRILVGIESERVRLGPNIPLGTYFLDEDLETLLQWDGERWQGVAHFTPAGRIADKDDPFRNYFAALGRSGEGDAAAGIVATGGAGSGASGAGGGGISPAPRAAGDPSLTAAQPGVIMFAGTKVRLAATIGGVAPQNFLPIPFDTTVYAVGGVGHLGGNGIVIDRAGRYLVRAFLNFVPSVVNDVLYNASIVINGGAYTGATHAGRRPLAASASSLAVPVEVGSTPDIALAVGDVITVNGLGTTDPVAGNMNYTGGAGGTACFLEAIFLGT